MERNQKLTKYLLAGLLTVACCKLSIPLILTCILVYLAVC